MKLLRTMIAFFSVYVFVAIISVFLMLAFWLKSFIADSPSQTLAQVKVGEYDGETTSYAYFHNNGTNALITSVTRGEDQSSFAGQEVLAARSLLIFATYDEVTVSEPLVPLGFKTLYRLKKVTDSGGRVLYDREYTIVDEFIRDFGGEYVEWKPNTITLTQQANDKPVMYTITAAEEHLFVAKDYED